MLFAKAYLAMGDYDTAADYLTQAQAACWSDETEYWQTVHASILQLMAEVAVAQDDGALAIEHYSQALEHLTTAARAFIWDTSLRRGLVTQIHEVVDPLAALLDDSGEFDRAVEVRRTAAAAEKARELAFQPLPTEVTPASRALQEYRTTLTHLDNQRGERYYLLGVPGEAASPWSAYWTRTDLDWKYRQELVRQQAQINRELEARIAELEANAARQLIELQQLDPQTAAIIELQPVE